MNFQLRSLLLGLAALVPVSATADQFWTGATDGLWTTAANWNSAIPGVGDIAIFDATSTANLATTLGADQTVAGLRITAPTSAVSVAAGNTLTVGASGIDLSSATQNLTFNNTFALGTAQTWNVGTGRTLFGSSTSVVSGAFGLTKAGAGILTLQGTNTFNGGVNVTGGTLTVKNNSGAGTGGISLANGTAMRLERNGSASVFVGNAVTVAAGATVIMTSDNAANGYSGIVTGDAASTFQIGNSGALTQVSFSAGTNTQQFSGFAGTVKIFDGASIRFSSTSALNNGSTTATFDLGLTGNLTARNGGTVNLGALTGSGSVVGSSGATGTTLFSIGGKNTASVFSGSISNEVNNPTARIAAVTKVGTESLTLSGSSTYSGPTNVNAGKLLITGTINGLGAAAASSVTVGSAGTLGGTGALGGVVTVNGTIAPGMSAGTLTISNNLILNSSATLSYELNGTNQTVGGGVNDLLSGITALTLDGTINVTELGSFGGLSSGSWRLINYSGSLIDNGLTLGAVPVTDPGTNFVIDTTTAGQVNLVLVPEPGSLLLTGLSAAALLRRRRRC